MLDAEKNSDGVSFVSHQVIVQPGSHLSLSLSSSRTCGMPGDSLPTSSFRPSPLDATIVRPTLDPNNDTSGHLFLAGLGNGVWVRQRPVDLPPGRWTLSDESSRSISVNRLRHNHPSGSENHRTSSNQLHPFCGDPKSHRLQGVKVVKVKTSLDLSVLIHCFFFFVSRPS